ncbi:MAG: hypothetical protein LLG20_22655 [Acidobacteriales bacterium]|nr:hypothetical protein [Terriglobales bacterium]
MSEPESLPPLPPLPDDPDESLLPDEDEDEDEDEEDDEEDDEELLLDDPPGVPPFPGNGNSGHRMRELSRPTIKSGLLMSAHSVRQRFDQFFRVGRLFGSIPKNSKQPEGTRMTSGSARVGDESIPP